MQETIARVGTLIVNGKGYEVRDVLITYEKASPLRDGSETVYANLTRYPKEPLRFEFTVYKKPFIVRLFSWLLFPFFNKG